MNGPSNGLEGAQRADATVPAALTRREFVGAALLVGSLAMLPRWVQAFPVGVQASTSPVAPVISFHMDQPYVDYTGTAEPYIPPAGARSAAGIADLDDETVFGTLRL